MNNAVFVFLAGIVFLCLVLLFGQFFGPFLLRYKITESSVEASAFGLFRIWKVDFADIIAAQKISFKELLPWRNPKSIFWVHMGNRIWCEAVVIRRKSGLLRVFVISPTDPESFAREIKVRMPAT
jgi:hypothetical protein